MKQALYALAAAAVLACKQEESKATDVQDKTFVVDNETRAMMRSADCKVLRSGIEDAQQRISDKAGAAYSAKAFEEIAALRAAFARDATLWNLGIEEDQKLAADWSALNLKAAAAERRVALSFGDAGSADAGRDAASDASTVEDELGQMATMEDKVFADLQKLCPKLAPH